MICSGIPNKSCFILELYATILPLKYADDPGIDTIVEAILPPVTLSAVQSVFPESFKRLPTVSYTHLTLPTNREV